MALFVILLRILKLTPFEFEVVMSQQPVEKKSVPWLLMGLGLLIPFFLLLEYFSWLQKVMLRLKKQYEQQRLEMEKRIAEKEAASSEKK